MALGHGQCADIFKPKTRYLREIFNNLSDEMKFEFEYLSGVFPAYPDDDDEELQDLRVWGYGEPNHDHIRGLHGSLYHILDTLDRHGPFSGIVGFSSGAAMAAIITSLLEKRKNVCGIKWKVVQKLLILVLLNDHFITDRSYLDAAPTVEIFNMP